MVHSVHHLSQTSISRNSRRSFRPSYWLYLQHSPQPFTLRERRYGVLMPFDKPVTQKPRIDSLTAIVDIRPDQSLAVRIVDRFMHAVHDFLLRSTAAALRAMEPHDLWYALQRMATASVHHELEAVPISNDWHSGREYYAPSRRVAFTGNGQRILSERHPALCSSSSRGGWPFSPSPMALNARTYDHGACSTAHDSSTPARV